MFTGIITETGTLESRARSRVAIRASRRFVHALTIGASVSVSGVCLTVVEKGKGSFFADIMPETARRSTLGALKRGQIVNLELPATPTSLLSGHIVQGHVEGMGVVKNVTAQGNSKVLSIAVAPSLAHRIVQKGSIAVDGISLTVVSARRSGFTVGIIPHTRSITTLRTVKRGDKVNIETDVLATHARGIITKTRSVKKIKDIRIGIIGSSFREEVTKELEKHCVATLKKRRISKKQIKIVRVPGAFEIPLIAQKMAKEGAYDALITFGAIVKGKTYHFEQIANECARGCAEVSRAYDIPVIFEVLAVYDIKDAVLRATRTRENKGVEAAETALSMIRILSDI